MKKIIKLIGCISILIGCTTSILEFFEVLPVSMDKYDMIEIGILLVVYVNTSKKIRR
jgi:hypothetical protein